LYFILSVSLLVVLADAVIVAVAVNVYMSHFPGNLHSHHNIAGEVGRWGGVAHSSPIQEQRATTNDSGEISPSLVPV